MVLVLQVPVDVVALGHIVCGILHLIVQLVGILIAACRRVLIVDKRSILVVVAAGRRILIHEQSRIELNGRLIGARGAILAGKKSRIKTGVILIAGLKSKETGRRSWRRLVATL